MCRAYLGLSALLLVAGLGLALPSCPSGAPVAGFTPVKDNPSAPSPKPMSDTGLNSSASSMVWSFVRQPPETSLPMEPDWSGGEGLHNACCRFGWHHPL